MLNGQEFSRIVFTRTPKRKKPNSEIDNIQGIDSEAYDTGEPFIICLSNGRSFHPKNFLKALFKTPNLHYAAYNLKYDSGALLYFMPEEFKINLWERGKAYSEDFQFTYIPHKHLSIRHRSQGFIKIWDISQFFKMSLDNAAKKYLDKSKIELPTKTFTRAYKKEHFTTIKKYCVHDAKLTADLANFLVNKMKEFGIRTTALYSSASLSYQYYSDKTTICQSFRYWKYHKLLMKFAQEAYQGGKFEITARGSYYGYEYDITSAYPYEIANLIDISFADLLESKNYQKDAVYGYLRVKIYNPKGLPIPCGLLIKSVVVYPAGEFYTTITKQEYDYLKSIGLDVEIIQGQWLFVDKIVYPYRETTDKLFELKSYYKERDPTLSQIAKTMANSFYGKTIQLIPTYDGKIRAGQGWNPMHAAVITANTRIKVTHLQNLYKKDCTAVHTDSVMLKKPLKSCYITKALGGFEPKNEGPSILIACGQYDLGTRSAFKGFCPSEVSDEIMTWESILKKYPNKSEFSFPILKVQSWIDAAAKGNFSKVNYFEISQKQINLNVDLKRTWRKKATSNTLLKSLEYSEPITIVHTKQPETWSEKIE